jgi:hypothetical protein
MLIYSRNTQTASLRGSCAIQNHYYINEFWIAQLPRNDGAEAVPQIG